MIHVGLDVGLAVASLLMAGCEAGPYRRADTWHPTRANAGNIAAMATRLGDLIRGRSGTRTDARQSAEAVDRVWQGQARPLPAASSTAPQAAVAPVSGAVN